MDINLIAKNDEYSRDAVFNIQVFTADYSSGELQKEILFIQPL